MTVSELIVVLQTHPGDLRVVVNAARGKEPATIVDALVLNRVSH